MMTGEITIDELLTPGNMTAENSKILIEYSVAIMFFKSIIFFAFIVTVVVVFQNLLIGLTVDDMDVRDCFLF